MSIRLKPRRHGGVRIPDTDDLDANIVGRQ